MINKFYETNGFTTRKNAKLNIQIMNNKFINQLAIGKV